MRHAVLYVAVAAALVILGFNAWRLHKEIKGNADLTILTSDSNNLGIGKNVLRSLTSGSCNVVIGDNADDQITTGNYNIVILPTATTAQLEQAQQELTRMDMIPSDIACRAVRTRALEIIELTMLATHIPSRGR